MKDFRKLSDVLPSLALKQIAVFLFLLFSAFAMTVNAEKTILLADPDEDYFLSDEKIDVLEDPSSDYSIDEISSPAFQNRFHALKTEFPENKTAGASYWIRFKVRSVQPELHWMLECYTSHIDEIKIFIRDHQGKYEAFSGSSNYHFSRRTFAHKNLEFLLPDFRQEETVYIRFISHKEGRVRFLIRTYQQFTNHAINEYYLLGLFYGMILIISIYNLFLYPRLRDIAYLYYGIYAICVGLFSMTQDGLGFQYLWPDHPQWNLHSKYFFLTLMVVFMLLYTKSFLETRQHHRLINQFITAFIIIRISLLLMAYLWIPAIADYIWIDLAAYFLCYVTSIVAISKKQTGAGYFVIGFSILFLAFLINLLHVFNLLQTNIFTIYAIHIGAVLEMILLSLALTERVRRIRENEMIKERLNKELEQKVKERTDALLIQKNIIEEKVKALDTFIYKASHDIKGPLKSLIGVATLGMKDTPDNASIYFGHALKTARKLDAIVKDLLHISKINNTSLELTAISFKDLIIDILETFEKLPGYDRMKFEIDIKQEEIFYSEKGMLYSVFQNFIENAIKYRNPSSENNKLKIKVKSNASICEIKFIDNGIGVPEEYFDKIFDMFFRINEQSDESTGLGLYIVKLSVEKLGGQVYIQSRAGEETTFTVILKNQVPSVTAI